MACLPVVRALYARQDSLSMEVQVKRTWTIRERMLTLGASHAAINALAIAMLVAWCCALIWYLLAHYPYDGLYGQNSYAYYYQARAILQDITGQAPQPWQLFSGAQLYHWPVGYHLLMILGQLISGSVAGGRALTIITTVGADILLFTGWPALDRLNFPMADAGGTGRGRSPAAGRDFHAHGAICYGRCACVVFRTAWHLLLHNSLAARGPCRPVSQASGGVGRYLRFGAGPERFLTRYGAIFLAVPIGVYYIVRCGSRLSAEERIAGARDPALLWAFLGFAVGILPQLIYLSSYNELISSAGAGISNRRLAGSLVTC